MKHYIILQLSTLVTLNVFVHAQALKGIVKGYNLSEKNKTETTTNLQFANVYWLDKSEGTTTDGNGYFKISKTEAANAKLVFSYIGYKSDTIEILNKQQWIQVVLVPTNDIDEITINERISGSYISTIEPRKTEIISEKGLQKLACCNLSESFENSATVDVGYSDAITGAKQIQMLGLAGKYTQIMTENIPSLRGLASTFGLGQVPGSWMQSIQISKGTGSVVNGYESTTGQINIEYKKPEHGEPLFINLYGNSKTKGEINVTSATKINNKLSTMLLAHASIFDRQFDHNNDSFLDEALNKQINVMNRWKYLGEKRYRSQFIFHYINESRDGGQQNYFNNIGENHSPYYGFGVDINRLHFIAKNGFTFDKPGTSVGTQISSNLQSQSSFYGLNNLESKNNNVYANAIFQTYIVNTNHNISTGVSYMYDLYEENFNDTVLLRNEHIPGVFGEYTFIIPEKLTVITGLRTDYNSIYNWFVTPRVHLKYTINENVTFRASTGKGFRTANVYSEHSAYLVSSRNIFLIENLKPEEAWNSGANITYSLNSIERKIATLTLDYYRTNFINQIIADADQNSHAVYFYNLKGKSFSNSYQAEILAEPIKSFEITLAYRYNDIKQTINNELIEKPLVNKYKGLINLSYATRFDKWQFSFTTHFNGKVRLPRTDFNPVEYQLSKYSPFYTILHSQITKKFKLFEVYIGGENLANFRQKNPIIAPNDPFGDYFDASMVWGPLMGRMIYAGLRYSID